MKLRAVELPARAPGLDRTLVLFHGFGADENDLLAIGDELDPRLRVVSLQALEAVEEIARGSPRPLLGGFSQGAGVALSVALPRPDLTSGLLVLSGLPPPAAQGPPGGLGGLPAFVAHGLHDPLIPVEVGRGTRDLLTRLGAEVTYREYPMGHMVVPAELSDARTWLSSVLA
jgi:phospholipase/carboxylesterase